MALRDHLKSLELQALWFRAAQWTRDAAAKWCADHDLEPVAWRTREGDDGVVTHHIAVIFQPDEAVEGSFRTIADDFPEGVSATIAERKAAVHQITKTGQQSESDPWTFVMSTEQVDRDGDIIRQDGIDLRNFKRNPVALFAHDHRQPIGTWENVRVEGKRLLGELKLAAEGTSEMIDTLRRLVEQRILKAVSIGFGVKEYERMEEGYEFTGTELYECSLVAVPANQGALRVKAAKIVPDELQPLFFEEGTKGRSRRARKSAPDLTRKSARQGLETNQKSSDQKGTRPMNIAERIQAKEARLVAVKDRVTEIKSLLEADEDYELTDDETEELATLSDEQDALIKSIESLRTMEETLARKAAPAKGYTAASGAKPTVPAQAAKKEQGGNLLIKTITAAVIAKMTDRSQDEVRSELYGDDDRVAAVSKAYFARTIKSATDAADTTTAGWAAELVRNDIRGFLTELAPLSVYASLVNRGNLLSFDGANSVTIPRRNRTNQSSGAAAGAAAHAHLGAQMGGAWVGEGGVIPVKQMALSSQTLNRYKTAVISAFTNELMEQSVPNIETIIRSAILEDTALALDGGLLDGVAAVAGVRPASIVNGVTGTASAGATAANIITDLKVLFAAMNAINGASPVLILNSNRLLGLSTITTAAGGFMFRDEVAAGRLLGVPFIASTTVNPATVVIVDANSFWGANDAPRFAVSDQATLTMANADGTAPTQAGDATDHTGGAIGDAEQVPQDGGIIVTGDTSGAPAGAAVAGYGAQSMWQQYQTAVRMVLPASWAMTRPNSVAMLTGVAW